MRWNPALVALVLCQACDGPGPDADAPPPFEVWVADPGAGEVLTWDGRTGAELEPVVALADDAQPSALVVQDGRLLVADFRTGQVDAYVGGRFAAMVHRNQPDGIRIEEPCAMQARGGELLVLANDSWNVAVLGADGADQAEVGADDPIVDPHGFDVLPDGTLVIGTSPSAPGIGLVQVWDPVSGARLRAFAPYPELAEATAVTVVDGELVVTDWVSGTLTRYTLDGERVGEVAAGLDHPIATHLARTGELVVLTATGVVRVDSDGAQTALVDGTDRFVAARNFVLAPARDIDPPAL